MSNILTKETILAEAAALAANEGKSSNAKIELVMSMAQAAQARTIVPADAGAIFDTYLAAKNASVVDPTTLTSKKQTGTKVTEGYAAKTKSEWKQILSCGAHPTADGVEALNIGRDVALAQQLHVYDALIRVARVQLKSQTTLTRAEVETALRSESQEKDTSELKRLRDVHKAMEKIYNGTEAKDDNPGIEPAPSPALKQAMDLIQGRINDIAPSTEAAVSALMSAGFTEAQARNMLGRRK